MREHPKETAEKETDSDGPAPETKAEPS